MNESYHTYGCHTYECVMSHIWIRHVTHMIESRTTCRVGGCRTPLRYEWVMSHIWMGLVTHYTFEGVMPWVMSHIWRKSRTTCHHTYEESHERRIEIEFAAPRSGTNEACHTYIWVMSHIWMRRVTHMNESCHPYEWVMSLVWLSRVTHVNVSCHTCRSVILCVAWIIHMCRPVMSRIWMTGDTTHS